MNKTFKIILSLLLTFIAIPAFAEEAYVPPTEASEGVGGWAVVDPVTNVVHGVIVCDIQNCGPGGTFDGVLPGEYMGCTNCNLRFQTRATEDGNVAGYSGHSYDSSGNVNNDNSVKWEPSDNSFTIKNPLVRTGSLMNYYDFRKCIIGESFNKLTNFYVFGRIFHLGFLNNQLIDTWRNLESNK
jgi:hypothetical protein